MGTTKNLKVGMRVLAIGNPFGLDRTLTTGVISALGRTIEREDQAVLGEVIQTDAAINPGNSGGPLLNLRGEVIGVNTSIRSPIGASVGIGFAVPADTVVRIVPELIARGRYDHPWLGIVAYEITPDLARILELPVDRGLLIAQVQPGAAADRAGVRGATQQLRLRGGYLLIGGDILTSVDGRPIATRDQLTIYLENNKRVGEAVTLSLIRDGQPITLTATLTARP
jgi:S1-C subfamily serine protease